MAYSLVFGACLGGNSTLVGSAANVVACGIAKQRGHLIRMKDFSKIGVPVTLVNIAAVYVYCLLRFVKGKI